MKIITSTPVTEILARFDNELKNLLLSEVKAIRALKSVKNIMRINLNGISPYTFTAA